MADADHSAALQTQLAAAEQRCAELEVRLLFCPWHTPQPVICRL